VRENIFFDEMKNSAFLDMVGKRIDSVSVSASQ